MNELIEVKTLIMIATFLGALATVWSNLKTEIAVMKAQKEELKDRIERRDKYFDDFKTEFDGLKTTIYKIAAKLNIE